MTDRKKELKKIDGLENISSANLWSVITKLLDYEWAMRDESGNLTFKYVATSEANETGGLAKKFFTKTAESKDKICKYQSALENYTTSGTLKEKRWLLTPDVLMGNLKTADYVFLLLNPGLGEYDCDATSEEVLEKYPELKNCFADSILQNEESDCVNPYLYFLGEHYIRLSRGQEGYNFISHGGFAYYAGKLLLNKTKDKATSYIFQFYTDYENELKELLSEVYQSDTNFNGDILARCLKDVQKNQDVNHMSYLVIGTLLKEFSKHVAVIQLFPYHTEKSNDFARIAVHEFIAYLEIFYVMQRANEFDICGLNKSIGKTPALYCIRGISRRSFIDIDRFGKLNPFDEFAKINDEDNSDKELQNIMLELIIELLENTSESLSHDCNIDALNYEKDCIIYSIIEELRLRTLDSVDPDTNTSPLFKCGAWYEGEWTIEHFQNGSKNVIDVIKKATPK